MRVLFDIVHPANVLFFNRPMKILAARGDEILVLSRHKDVACDLLNGFGIGHRPVSRAGGGPLGLAWELVRRDFGVLAAARRFRPDVMIGFGGVAISHVGRMLGIPAIAFYDTERATLQTKVTWPFISRLYVPEAYCGPVPAARTRRVPGVKELSYFHPDHFTPSRERALASGFDPAMSNFLIRLVSWGAAHDIGKSGWSQETLDRVVDRLCREGKVHVSSEAPLPDALERLRYSGPPNEIHHLAAHCTLVCGESSTMASEASVQAVPAIYAGVDPRGYTDELEAAGLIDCVPADQGDRILAALETRLAMPRDAYEARWNAYFAEKPDWAEVIVAALDAEVTGGPRPGR